MNDSNNPKDGSTTLYYTNTQSARLMFYHDHSFGITRLNVYAGEAAPYIIRDNVEKDLINGTNFTGVNPRELKLLPQEEIPLVIQDRTFVDEATILQTDPTWAWGTNPATPATATTPYVAGTPRTGDLWYPHVYSPAQDPYDITGANPFGRWMYGPWFYPPTDNIEHPPIPNPYHDPTVDPNDPNYRPPMMPGTPNPSAPGESFMDTPLVNGTVYPYLEVDPQAYRFRILNAANDRFFSLSFYVADDSYAVGEPGYLTEVKMTAATPGTLPTHLAQVMPDPGVDGANLGPSWIQIGTEGGFLPTPVEIEPQPTTWNLVGTAFNFGNVATHGLLLGAAERADVIVDFSQYAGKTLIMYNDAPAPFPANDTRYDYFTGNPNQEEIGGTPSTLPGYGPNTRTIMQVKVAAATPVPYDTQPLYDVFKKGAIPATETTETNKGVFATGQDTIIIPQAAYNDAYGVTDLPADANSAYVQLDENDKTFRPINREGVKQSPVSLPLEPMAMDDEMSGFFDEFGRMSGFLGLTSPTANATVAPFISYGYSSPPVEIFKGIEEDLDAVQIGSMDDGTQIWQITHNGVDTHPVHTHLFSAQLINRVAWDGAMLPPEENELGWKETFRINPLEQTVIAMRPKVPAASELPFAVPNSERLIDPTMPDGASLPAPPPESWFNPQGIPLNQVLNHVVNYGWEYVYHCHILSHEEMDMMHSMAVGVKPAMPTNLVRTFSGSGTNRAVVLTWEDNSSNETGFMVQRSLSGGGPWTTLATVGRDIKTYSDRIGNTNTSYYYKIIAVNIVGDTLTPGFPTVTMKSGDSNIVNTGTTQANIPGSPTGLTAVVQPGPQVLLTWTDNASNESGFLVERRVGTGVFTLLTTVPARNNTGSVSYTDMNVLPGTTYDYRVAAINSEGTSAYSNTASVTTLAPPAAPSLVNATAEIASKRNAKVTITWRDNANNESGFTIERSTNATFTGTNVVTVNVNANVTTYTTGNVLRNTPYYFRIRANNGAGSSVWVNATPFPITTP
jgi:FtsP/CotA-like multicopper oxidase with cupredoxin domain